MTPQETAEVLHGAYTMELAMPAWAYLLLGLTVAMVGFAGGRARVGDEKELRQATQGQAREGRFAMGRAEVQAAQLDALTVALRGETTRMEFAPRGEGLPEWPPRPVESLRADLADTLTYQRAIADSMPVIHREVLPDFPDALVYDLDDPPHPLDGAPLDADELGDAAVNLGGEDGQDTPPDGGSGAGGGEVVEPVAAPAEPPRYRHDWGAGIPADQRGGWKVGVMPAGWMTCARQRAMEEMRNRGPIKVRRLYWPAWELVADLVDQLDDWVAGMERWFATRPWLRPESRRRHEGRHRVAA